jgi:hypothetical protein
MRSVLMSCAGWEYYAALASQPEPPRVYFGPEPDARRKQAVATCWANRFSTMDPCVITRKEGP